MVFVGEQEVGYFAEEFARKNNLQYAYVPVHIHIEEQINLILEFQKQDYTIFDISQYTDDVDFMANEIVKICNANGSKPIIYAAGFVKNSSALIALRERGVRYFILANTLSKMKDQLEKCMNGYYDANEIEEIAEYQAEQEREREAEVIRQGKLKFIGVAGACNRIGTTTHAIQIVKYLLLKGYKACYIQLNNTDYINTMKEWFVIDSEDTEIGRITYGGVDHFYRLDKLSEVMKFDYEYFVYDFGVYLDQDFNRVSFLEKNIKIFIVGSDPSELPYTYKVIKNAFYDDVKYVFNFSSMEEKADLDELMDEKKECTFIAGFIPDKYVLSSSELYAKVIPVEKKMEEGGKKKRRFFHK